MTDDPSAEAWQRVGALLPGPTYLQHLSGLHMLLRPTTYLEIGVHTGLSLHLAQPPTQAFGVDPDSRIGDPQFAAPTQLFAMTSDAFFAVEHAGNALRGAAIDLAFIDGLHLFEQALRDFINVERHAAPHGVIALHDTLPVTAASAAREPIDGLWCGDVWRILPCLGKWRPDLHVASIPAPPSGLTVATRLDPASRVLEAHYDAIVAEFLAYPYAWLEAHLAELTAARDNSPTTLVRALGLTDGAAR